MNSTYSVLLYSVRRYRVLSVCAIVLFFVCLGRFYFSLHQGFGSQEYLNFDRYSSALLAISTYSVLISLSAMVFEKFKGIRTVVQRVAVSVAVMDVLMALALTRQLSGQTLGHSIEKMSQGLFLSGLLLTYLLYGVIDRWGLTRSPLSLLVVSLGLYFSAITSVVALRRFVSIPGMLLNNLHTASELLLIACWVHAFLRIPKNSHLCANDTRLVLPLDQARRQVTRSSVKRPPGALLRSLAEFFCSTNTLEGVVSPLISDMRIEYWEALRAGRNEKAAWIRIRGCWALFKVLGLLSIVKAAVHIWRGPSSD